MTQLNMPRNLLFSIKRSVAIYIYIKGIQNERLMMNSKLMIYKNNNMIKQ